MAARVDQVATLPDGRRVGYDEYGDLNGRPLMLLHALFFARSFGEVVEEAALAQGVRVISPDRPGVGLSDFYPWSFEEYARDVGRLGDVLGLGRFAVVGVSAGGAHALACARWIPERLSGVGVVGGVAPPVPEVLRELPRSAPLRWPARRLPWLWGPQMWLMSRVVRARPGLGVRMMARMLDASDRAILSRPEIRSYMEAGMREAMRQGGRPWAHEARQTGSVGWAAWLPEIAGSVHLWQGEADRLSPPVMGRYLESVVPGCELVWVAGAGHLWAIDHMGEVMEVVVG